MLVGSHWACVPLQLLRVLAWSRQRVMQPLLYLCVRGIISWFQFQARESSAKISRFRSTVYSCIIHFLLQERETRTFSASVGLTLSCGVAHSWAATFHQNACPLPFQVLVLLVLLWPVFERLEMDCQVSYALVMALVLHAARLSANSWFDQLPWFIRVAEKCQAKFLGAWPVAVHFQLVFASAGRCRLCQDGVRVWRHVVVRWSISHDTPSPSHRPRDHGIADGAEGLRHSKTVTWPRSGLLTVSISIVITGIFMRRNPSPVPGEAHGEPRKFFKIKALRDSNKRNSRNPKEALIFKKSASTQQA